MTVVVGLLCRDGVVVGTDSAATFTAGVYRTIEQPTRKISLIDGQVIMAATGSGGLTQRFEQIVTLHQTNGGFRSLDPLESGRRLCGLMRKDFGDTGALKQDGDGGWKADYGALIGFWHAGQACLLEFEVGSLQPELKTADIWYVSMGSGQLIADPFLGLMRRAFCVAGPPTLAMGRFITAWTLNHTIELNPGGIGGPMQIAVLSREAKGQPTAKLDDVDEHLAAIEGVYEHLAEYPSVLETEGGELPE